MFHDWLLNITVHVIQTPLNVRALCDLVDLDLVCLTFVVATSGHADPELLIHILDSYMMPHFNANELLYALVFHICDLDSPV